jgi:SAM-dependent methyltransferase
VRQVLKRALTRVGLRVERISDEERLLRRGYDPRHLPPPNDLAYLAPDNPRLIALEDAYRQQQRDPARPSHMSSTWAAAQSSTVEDLRYFRGDNLYLWQYTRSPLHNRYRYFIYGRYVEGVDSFGLLGKVLEENGEFGCFTFEFDGMPAFSRDLLDSVNELTFLGRHAALFDIPDCGVLDIGAGYGRLAHRALEAAPNITHYWCIDALARSTFLSEYYLRHRGLGDRGVVIPLTELDAEIGGLAARKIDIAVNIHSFSEMPQAAVGAWLSMLADLQVPQLFVVPNEKDEVLSRESDGTRRDCGPLFHEAGYRLAISEPAIRDAAVRDVLEVHDHFLLYERT